MKVSALTSLGFAICYAGLSAAEYDCVFNNATAWPSSSSSGSSSTDPGVAGEIIQIEGAADAQAICDSDLDQDCTTTTTTTDDGDGGVLRIRQEAADAAQSITCEDSEVCLLYPTGYLICIDPNSGDYIDQFDKGNLISDVKTDLANGAVTTITGATSSGSVSAMTSDAAQTSATESMTTTSAFASGQSVTTASSVTGSATAHASGAAASKAVRSWEYLMPAALGPFLYIAM